MSLQIPLRLSALVLTLAVAAPASAVIIDSGDGTGNTSAPSPDPGWAHVGTCNGLTAVYVGGNGWVLTANHVGTGGVTLSGVLYPWAPGTAIRLNNPDNSPADLLMFHLQPPYPALSDLSIPTATPALGTALIMIGQGRDRGAATSWMGINGWLWGPGVTIRWGTNFVEDVQASMFQSGFGTHLFGSVFDHGGSTAEAQGAYGDSGGAVFASNGPGYNLAGILIGIATYQNQPAETALYGNYTFAGDLSVYHDQIVATMPEPAGGLWAGAALLAAIARTGRRSSTRSFARRSARRG